MAAENDTEQSAKSIAGILEPLRSEGELTDDREILSRSESGKIEKLFAVITLAFTIRYGWGCEMKANPTLTAPQKKKSIFRLGLDRITQITCNKEDFEVEIQAFLRWFEQPNYRSIFVV